MLILLNICDVSVPTAKLSSKNEVAFTVLLNLTVSFLGSTLAISATWL